MRQAVNDEFVGEGDAAILVPGRAGQCWRYDAETGFFREKWRPPSRIDPDYVARQVAAIEGLTAEPERIAAMGRVGRKAVREHYTIETWNAGLEHALHAATGPGDRAEMSGAGRAQIDTCRAPGIDPRQRHA